MVEETWLLLQALNQDNHLKVNLVNKDHHLDNPVSKDQMEALQAPLIINLNLDKHKVDNTLCLHQFSFQAHIITLKEVQLLGEILNKTKEKHLLAFFQALTQVNAMVKKCISL